MSSREWLALGAVGLPALGALVVAAAPRSVVERTAIVASLLSATVGAALSVVALAHPGAPEAGRWVVVDAAAGVLVATITAVALASALVSPAYLRGAAHAVVREERAARVYWATLLAFWAVLVAVPLAGNLGAAWVLVEATTAASALLVGFSGRPRALEAGWKYLLLTSLGLGIALLGIVVLAAAGGGASLDALSWRALPHGAFAPDDALVAYVLILAGLAAKAGWAPVHNWLPDAHSEAPPPVSALLSAALLPAVALVAWRTQQGLAPTIGVETSQVVLVGFGLVSLLVAVPFLWRPLAWKRLLAYSSLEHMGVIALGIGFGSPLAIAGVAVHVAGHGVAKALGFYAAAPLLAHDARAARHPVSGIARSEPALAASLGVSLAALAGVPPSPLFVSEVLIVAGGFEAGRPWAAAAAAAALALGFLGLAHGLLDLLAGRPRGRHRAAAAGLRPVVALTAVATVALLALTAAAIVLPGSAVVQALERGLG